MFYRDVDVLSSGEQDYARLLDFNQTEDLIQLSGLATDYTLGSVNNSQSTALWYTESSGQSELIAILEQTQISDFNTGFSFV